MKTIDKTDWKDEKIPDQNLLRGAKAIADKIDFGSILMDVTAEDIESLKPLIEQGFPTPNVKMSIYKNRRGRYKGMYLWMIADKGTCRYNPVFATNYQYEAIEIKNTKVKVVPRVEESAF